MRPFLIALLALAAAAPLRASERPSERPSPAVGGVAGAVHPLHMTYGRVAVDGATVLVSVRFFKDDLTDALRDFTRRGDDLALAVTPELDAIALRYFNARLSVVANGTNLTARLVGSAEAAETWTYRVEYRATQPVRTLRLRNRLLFETFPDQQNVVKTAVFPSGHEDTILFLHDEDTHDVRI